MNQEQPPPTDILNLQRALYHPNPNTRRAVLSAIDELIRLRDELAALKANDPLTEMWAALEEYQPQADRDGHGDTWRHMCAACTHDSAFDAAEDAAEDAARAAAQDAAQDAVRVAAWAALWATRAADSARDAIAAIRRAKGGQP